MGNNPNAMMSPAVMSLGLGGSQLSQQQQDQSEELRKKKQREMQLSQMGPAAASIFGPLGGGLSG